MNLIAVWPYMDIKNDTSKQAMIPKQLQKKFTKESQCYDACGDISIIYDIDNYIVIIYIMIILHNCAPNIFTAHLVYSSEPLSAAVA